MSSPTKREINSRSKIYSCQCLCIICHHICNTTGAHLFVCRCHHVIIIIIKKISGTPLYHTRWESRPFHVNNTWDSSASQVPNCSLMHVCITTGARLFAGVTKQRLPPCVTAQPTRALTAHCCISVLPLGHIPLRVSLNEGCHQLQLFNQPRP